MSHLTTATEEVPVTDEMRLEARRRHEDIIHHGARTLEHMQALGEALGDMRDRRLYLAMGHSSFDAYCTQALGVSRDWADRRIQIGQFIESHAAALRQIPNLSQTSLRILAKLPAPEQAEFLQAHPVQDMSTRELEAAVRQARQEADEANRRAEVAEGRAKVLENRPPRTVEVTRPDPEQEAEIERLRQALAEKGRAVEAAQQDRERVRQLLGETQRELQALRERADKDGSLEARIKEKEERLRELADMEAQLGARFDDGDREPDGGLKLMDALFPVERVMPRALSAVRGLQQKGVGGWCQDDDVKRLAEQLREMSRLLDSIVKDRASRPILADFREV